MKSDLQETERTENNRNEQQDRLITCDISRAGSPYVEAFREWMTTFNPDAFVTINLPRERNHHCVPRDPQFYLNCWTRCAEADVLGTRTLKLRDFDRRIVWIFRREVAPDGLIHYHAIVRFPVDRTWRDETPAVNSVVERCRRLQNALKAASSRTPEPFTRRNGYLPNVADIDVRPFDHDHNHARYILKGLWRYVPANCRADESTWDSGLIILPHFPKRGA